MDLKQTMLDTKVSVNIQKGGQWIRTQITEVFSDGRKVTMSEEGGEPFQLNTEGQDTATGLLTLREAIQRIFPTLVQLFRLTEEPDPKDMERKAQKKGGKQTGWAQVSYSLRARLRELKEANPTSRGEYNIPDPELTDLKKTEQAFMAIRPKLILAGYKTLNSIPCIHKASEVQFFCPPLKGVDSQTQERVTNRMKKLHKFPAHMHSLGLKNSKPQQCPRIEQLQGLKMTQLLDESILTRNSVKYIINVPNSETSEKKASNTILTNSKK